MEQSLFNVLFELRYGERVLERQARFWRRIDAITRMLGLFSGTVAFAAITHENQTLTMVFGVIFALFQALEFTVMPGSKAAEAYQASKLYTAVLAEQSRIPLDELIQKLHDTRIKDNVIAFEALREPAYNDVAIEKGHPEACFKLTFSSKIMRMLA